MTIPWPRVRPLSWTPLKVASFGKMASAAPVTADAPVCAASGGIATTLASPRMAVNTNPSRVIIVPLPSLFDLDVPAGQRAAFGVTQHSVGVRDFERVRARAGLRLVFDLR